LGGGVKLAFGARNRLFVDWCAECKGADCQSARRRPAEDYTNIKRGCGMGGGGHNGLWGPQSARAFKGQGGAQHPI